MKMYMEDIEDIILGMAEVVKENKRLRQQLMDLDLECRKYKACATGNYKEGERLSDLSIHNSGVKMAHNIGWLISDDELKYD
jgi:hypothetical protein